MISRQLACASSRAVLLLLVHSIILLGYGRALGSDAIPDPENVDTAAITSAVEQYIYTRDCELRLYHEPGQPVVIPFKYRNRPTLTVNICGMNYDLLFDTGTQSSLLQPRAGEELPSQLRFSDEPAQLAPLEAKRAVASDGTNQLDYAIAPVVSCGDQVYIRDVPVRVYPPSVNADRDFSGAFSAMLFADYIVSVNNTDLHIELYERQDWQPPAGCLMMPLVLLPRGYFIPVQVAGEQYLFHMDTGFSGTVGLTGTALFDLVPYLTPVQDSQTFSGWHAEINMDSYNLACPFMLEPYPVEPWKSAPSIELSELKVLDFADTYQELEGQGYKIGGIIGSRFWGEFDYALDLRLQRLYVFGPRD